MSQLALIFRAGKKLSLLLHALFISEGIAKLCLAVIVARNEKGKFSIAVTITDVPHQSNTAVVMQLAAHTTSCDFSRVARAYIFIIDW